MTDSASFRILIIRRHIIHPHENRLNDRCESRSPNLLPKVLSLANSHCLPDSRLHGNNTIAIRAADLSLHAFQKGLPSDANNNGFHIECKTAPEGRHPALYQYPASLRRLSRAKSSSISFCISARSPAFSGNNKCLNRFCIPSHSAIGIFAFGS